MQIILNKEELRELLTTAWVNGWYAKKDKTDENKFDYARQALSELFVR